MIAFPGSLSLMDAIEIEKGKLIEENDLTKWYFEARLSNIEKQITVAPEVKSPEYKTYRTLKFRANRIFEWLNKI